MKTILIIEDESLIALNIKNVLRYLGYTKTFIASSGAQAIEIIEKKNPDLILADIVLNSDIDGIDLAKKIKEEYSIPLIFLTAHSDQETVEKAKLSEPYGFITKPFKVEEIRIALEIAFHKFEMEKKLIESKEKYHFLAEAIKDIIFTFDHEGIITFINSAFEEITGSSRSEFIGKHFSTIIDSEQLPERLMIKEVPTGKCSKPFEVKYQDKILEIFIKKIKKQNGFVGIIRDITHQKKIERALLESKKLNRTVIENSPIGISVRDKNGTLRLSNKSWQRIWGLSEEDISRDKEPRNGLVFDKKDSYIGDYLNKIEKIYKVGGEYHIPDIKLLQPKEDQAEWISQYFYSIMDDNGAVEQVVILTVDISKRKKVEEELRKYQYHLEELVEERTANLEREIAERKQTEVKLKNYKDYLEKIVKERTRSLKQSEDKYRSVYENMHLGIYRTTPEGKILMVNPALLKILQYNSFEELQRQNLEETGYYDNSRRREFKDEMQEHKQVSGFESTWKTSGGQKVFVRENAKAFCDKDGRILYYEGTIEDITEKKKAEEELKVNRERLRTANSILRHDVANDLVVIKSALDIYREGRDEVLLDEIDKRVDKSLSTIHKQREQEKFLNSHSKLDEYDIRRVIDNVVKNFPDIKINIEGYGKAYADNAIYSVFENIINNAIIHGNTKKVDIYICCTDKFCDIRFVDYGIGIPDEIKPVIFDEGFHYGEKGHTGIGLYIVQKTVDGYGGIVTVEDNKPTGAIFIVRLKRVIER